MTLTLSDVGASGGFGAKECHPVALLLSRCCEGSALKELVGEEALETFMKVKQSATDAVIGSFWGVSEE